MEYFFMCRLCERANDSAAYKSLIEKMAEEDIARMEFTKECAKTMRFVADKCYSQINLPTTFIYPMFEARMAYAVPSNYFQLILLDNEKIGNNFSHGAMRSVFFADGKLTVLSKTTNHADGKEFFTSFLLLQLNRNEYASKIDGESFLLSADVKKQMKNLVSGALEEKQVRFNFIHNPVKGRIVTREKVLTSAQFKSVYSKYAGGARASSASIDLEGYAVTVPHFAPHPYLLQLSKDFGFESNREFQEHAIDYFKAHAT
jgi:hypothetical protein